MVPLLRVDFSNISLLSVPKFKRKSFKCPTRNAKFNQKLMPLRAFKTLNLYKVLKLPLKWQPITHFSLKVQEQPLLPI